MFLIINKIYLFLFRTHVKVTKNKGVFPSDTALEKVIILFSATTILSAVFQPIK